MKSGEKGSCCFMNKVSKGVGGNAPSPNESQNDGKRAMSKTALLLSLAVCLCMGQVALAVDCIGCKTCNGTSGLCETCDAEKMPIDGVCPQCANHCTQCDFTPNTTSSECKACEKKMYLDNNGGCFPCGRTCKECTDPLRCTACAPGLGINSTGECSECSSDTYVSNTTSECVSCGEQCTVCSASGVCDQCAKGYNLLSNCTCEILGCTKSCLTCAHYPDGTPACTECNVGNQGAQNETCVPCSGGEYLSIVLNADLGKNVTVCTPCEACVNCDLTGACLSCADGKEVVNGTCVAKTPSCTNGCTACEFVPGTFASVCKQCPMLHFANGDTCERCHKSCYTCDGKSLTDCLTCNNATFPAADGKCMSCGSNHYDNNGTCAPCITRCNRCGASTGCDECSDGHEFHNDTCAVPVCASSCPGGYCHSVNNTWTCTACGNYAFPREKGCVPCHSSCKTCSDSWADSCTVCRDTSLAPLRGVCSTKLRHCSQEDTLGSIHGCKTCDTGYYKDSKNVCEKCSDSCTACTGPLAENCTSCNQEAMELVGTECVCTNTTRFNHLGTCTPCADGCASCKAPLAAYCTSCSHGPFVAVGGVCGCPDGTYHVGDGCSSCSPMCKTCKDSATKCTTCNENTFKSRDTCVAAIGFRFDLGGEPIACAANCAYCNADRCVACHHDYEVKNDTCVPCTGKGGGDGRCTECAPGCAYCRDTEHCTVCDGHYTGSVDSQADLTCDCPVQTFREPKMRRCEVCPDANCDVCDMYNEFVCQRCSADSALNANKTCDRCGAGMFAKKTTPGTNETCQSCNLNCMSCDHTPTNCTACASGSVITESRVCEPCPNGTYIDGNTCQRCKNGGTVCTADGTPLECAYNHFLNGSHCNKCTLPCLTCTSLSNCTSCPSPSSLGELIWSATGAAAFGAPTYLDGTRCVASCATGEYANSQGVCVPCSEGCSNCTGPRGECTKCSIAWFLRTVQKMCVKECPAGDYPQAAAGLAGPRCAPCASTCYTCSGTGGHRCTSCRNDATTGGLDRGSESRFLWEGECLNACPADTYKHRTRLECLPVTRCGSQEYRKNAPTQTSDAVCLPFTSCENGTFEGFAGNATHDKICIECEHGTYDSDRNPATPCVAVSHRNVTAQFVRTPATPTSDAIYGNYSSECTPGSAETARPTDSSDRVCTACAQGTFDHDGDASTACVACTRCEQGVDKKCTSTKDAVCNKSLYLVIGASVGGTLLVVVVIAVAVVHSSRKRRYERVDRE